jgi:2-C-methyl-D-erythritol 2,4-cyclodiphosphate synthase
VDHPVGLAGHSDADALTHAVIDALLGAAGLGDIGQHFPDTDERWRDADSIELLRTVRGMVGDAGLAPVHVDATVVCEAPRLGPYRERMRARLAEALGLDVAAVNVKFTTAEGMGWVGTGEGIAALAIATVGERRPAG